MQILQRLQERILRLRETDGNTRSGSAAGRADQSLSAGSQADLWVSESADMA